MTEGETRSFPAVAACRSCLPPAPAGGGTRAQAIIRCPGARDQRSATRASLRVTAAANGTDSASQLFIDIREVEDWTLNGRYSTGSASSPGSRAGSTLVRQRRRDDRQVPKFRADMTASEIAAMLESLFRVRGGTVEFPDAGADPAHIPWPAGFQYDFEHLDGDEVWRRGRAVGAVIDGRLYLILYDAARSHYYDAALGDFEAIVASARLAR